MRNFFILNKKIGETPLEALELFRNKKKIGSDVSMTYAGRLDPMAEGLLVVLSGDECKNKEKYLKLDKEYEFEVLFGLETDTLDILGKIVENENKFFSKKEFLSYVPVILKNIKKIKKLKYPLYSSKTVSGKPLFSYAREGENVDVPEKEIEIKNIIFLNSRVMTSEKILENINKRISKLSEIKTNKKKNSFNTGDFRQKEILKIWEKFLSKNQNKFLIAKFQVRCSSGTYVRVLAKEIGLLVGIPTIAFSIKRTKIGKWSKIES
jgi:tRNA pseudouridine(55) synthase